jgi:hypothetical protein
MMGRSPPNGVKAGTRVHSDATARTHPVDVRCLPGQRERSRRHHHHHHRRHHHRRHSHHWRPVGTVEHAHLSPPPQTRKPIDIYKCGWGAGS